MRRPDGVTLIAIYHIIIGLPFFIGACALLGVPISGALTDLDRVGAFWATFGLGIGFLFTAGGGLLSLIAGWGLIGMKNWARWLAIVLAVLSLPAFPVGTLIGGFILWYLFQENVRVLFENTASGSDAVESVLPPESSPPPAEEDANDGSEPVESGVETMIVDRKDDDEEEEKDS